MGTLRSSARPHRLHRPRHTTPQNTRLGKVSPRARTLLPPKRQQTPQLKSPPPRPTPNVGRALRPTTPASQPTSRPTSPMWIALHARQPLPPGPPPRCGSPFTPDNPLLPAHLPDVGRALRPTTPASQPHLPALPPSPPPRPPPRRGSPFTPDNPRLPSPPPHRSVTLPLSRLTAS